MKKIFVTILVVSLLFVGFLSVNNNQNEYKVTGEIREFLICKNSENEGFFIEKNEATNHIKKGDLVEIITNENNQIIEVVKK